MKYHLLIVDDEIHAIEGVKADLDVQKLHIAKLLTAHNIRQAKALFARERIDILLCDIEMPQGSGLELLSWVREHHPNTAVVFLTSHADFRYAQEALTLGSLDYLLKPALAEDLERAIRKAQSFIDRQSEMSRNSRFHQLWQKHHSLIIERFWLDLINQSTPSRPDAIREQAERHQIPLAEDSLYFPVLISVQRWRREMKRRDEKILEYALKNSAEELIVGSHENGICLCLDRGLLLVVFMTDRNFHPDEEKIKEACARYVESGQRYFYCHLSCYLGRPVELQEIAGMVAELKRHDRNNVAFLNQVFSFDQSNPPEQPIQLPELSVLFTLLKTGTIDAAIQAAEGDLDQLVSRQELDAETLHRFGQDFVQVLYSFLIAKGIQAHQLFGDETSRKISEAAGNSVDDMKAWIRHAVRKAKNQAEAVQENDTVVESVQRYIAINLDQDLSREMIADQVYLNPDYLSRLFKKETGYSISDYVLTARIQKAKELLRQTDLSVSSVASSVGYTNFSHFAKIFKKHVGIGPSEFRNQ